MAWKKSISLSTKKVRLVESLDWDIFVEKIYNRPYSLQQQDGCMGRGVVRIVINGDVIGVKFSVWLSEKENMNVHCGD